MKASKHSIYDASGVSTPRFFTGHGAPSTPGKGKLRPNNWGAKRLTKISASGFPHAGQSRFVQPTDASTAVVPPPGLGNPRNI